MSTTYKTIFKNLDLIVSGFFLSTTVVVVIANVLLRYLFQSGLFWAEEVATTAFIWSVFVGAAAAYRYKMHIGIDFVKSIGPKPWRILTSVIIDLMMLVINGYIAYLSVLFIQANKLKRTPVLDIPAIYVNLALTTGFSLMAAYALFFLCRSTLELCGRKEG